MVEQTFYSYQELFYLWFWWGSMYPCILVAIVFFRFWFPGSQANKLICLYLGSYLTLPVGFKSSQGSITFTVDKVHVYVYIPQNEFKPQ